MNWLPITEAMAKYGMARKSIRMICRRRSIAMRDVGRETMLDADAIAAYMAAVIITPDEMRDYITVPQFCELLGVTLSNAHSRMSGGKVPYRKVMDPTTHRIIAVIRREDAERHVEEHNRRYTPEQQAAHRMTGRKASAKWALKAESMDDDGADDPVPPMVYQARVHAIRLLRTPLMADGSPNPHYVDSDRMGRTREAVDRLAEQILAGEVPLDVAALGDPEFSPIENQRGPRLKSLLASA